MYDMYKVWCQGANMARYASCSTWNAVVLTDGKSQRYATFTASSSLRNSDHLRIFWMIRLIRYSAKLPIHGYVHTYVPDT
jgi:hypothetical protein